jgi:hypothetical protein
MPHPEHAIAQIAAGQHSVFSLDQATAAGMTRKRMRHLIDRGVYVRVAREVFAVGGSPVTWKRAVMIAVLTVGEDAAASHQTAAELWGLTGFRSGEIDVVVERWDRVHRGFSVHESRDLVDTDIELTGGIPVTSPARTVVDLGATAPWLVESALETGVRKGLITLADVELFVARVARRGRQGVGVIRPFIEARRRWDASTESQLEDLFLRVITAAGIPEPEAQFVVNSDEGFVCRADFAYPRHQLLIELDSEAHHMDRLTFRRDRDKQNRAELLGWRFLRYTWFDLTERPDTVENQLRRALSHPVSA